MGNHKGRSNGCKTCIQRRVKCDQNRPECTRCIAAGFTCLGYRESFIDGRQQILRRMNRKAATQSKTTRSSASILLEPNQNPVSIRKEPKRIQEPCYYTQLLPSPSLPLSAWKSDCFLSHLTASMAGPMRKLCYNLAIPSYRPDSAQRIATKECFLALASTFFGASHAQQSFVHDGRLLYGRALNMVSMTIKRPSTSITEILSAVFALCLHEAIEPTCNNQHSWLNHICGLEQIFAISGPPSAENDLLYHEMLEVTRFVMIVAALHGRRPSLMAQPEWSAFGQFQRINDIGPIPELSFLLDTLAQIPTLYRERDILITENSQSSTIDISIEGHAYVSRVETLLNRSLHLLNTVRCKRDQWRSSHPDEAFSTLPQTSFHSSQPYPCRFVTHFSSLSAANTYNLYATIVILLNKFIISMGDLLPLSNLQMLDANEEISVAVTEILSSMDYFLHLALTKPTSIIAIGASPSNFHLLPVRVAHKVLAESVLEEDVFRKIWLEDVISVIKGRSGLQGSNIQLYHIGSI